MTLRGPRFRRSYDRTNWWIRRSQSDEYQEAYDRIIRFANRDLRKAKTAVDVGCGPGELLRRLYTKVKSLVGTDMDLDMLKYARRNLTRRGIKVTMIPEVRERVGIKKSMIPEDGVLLVRDNILTTELPTGHFDHVLSSFPDLLTYGVFPLVDSKYGDISPEEIAIYQAFLMRRQMARLLRKRGRITECLYERDYPDHSRIFRDFIRNSYGGSVNLKRLKFFEDPSIGADMDDREYYPEEWPSGYTIYTVKKRGKVELPRIVRVTY
jgi:SAM-dependent methyltransferase